MAQFTLSGKALPAGPALALGVATVAAALWLGYSEWSRRAAAEPLIAQVATLATEVATLKTETKTQPAPRSATALLTQLQGLAEKLPGLDPLGITPTDDTGSLGLTGFNGVVLRVTIAGPMLAVAALCQKAQAALPFWVETLSSTQGRAQVVALLFGAGEES